MRRLIWAWVVALCLSPAAMVAHADEEKRLTLEVIRAEKKLMVSKNLKLTKMEAAGFWPVYDDFQKELQRLNGRRAKVIETYAKNYETLSNKLAKDLLAQALTLDEARANMKKLYFLKFKKVLPANKMVRYYQLESRLETVIRYELGTRIPLAEVE